MQPSSTVWTKFAFIQLKTSQLSTTFVPIKLTGWRAQESSIKEYSIQRVPFTPGATKLIQSVGHTTWASPVAYYQKRDDAGTRYRLVGDPDYENFDRSWQTVRVLQTAPSLLPDLVHGESIVTWCMESLLSLCIAMRSRCSTTMQDLITRYRIVQQRQAVITALRVEGGCFTSTKMMYLVYISTRSEYISQTNSHPCLYFQASHRTSSFMRIPSRMEMLTFLCQSLPFTSLRSSQLSTTRLEITE